MRGNNQRNLYKGKVCLSYIPIFFGEISNTTISLKGISSYTISTADISVSLYSSISMACQTNHKSCPLYRLYTLKN